ncbi:MAG: glycosyltransferase family 4 protein [Candidatus Omnitrophica bacterium]|nr:glycosyltransferase family 4 protein [Candidatus Omnitrophota bacterium]
MNVYSHRIKILFVHPNNKLTGQEFSLIERMRALKKFDVDCELMLPSEGDFSRLVVENDFPVLYGEMNRFQKLNPFPYWKTLTRIHKIIAERKPSLIHCSGIYPNHYCLPVARFNNLPIIGQVTTDVYNEHDVRCNFADRMDLIITCSKAAKVHLEKIGKMDKNKIECVYDGIAENDQEYSKHEIEKLKQEFKISDDYKVVGQLSEIIPRKGCEYFIDMAGKVKQSFPKVKFFIVGKNHRDEYEQKLREQIKHLKLENDVILTGFRKDAYAFLKMFDISVLASLAEGLGRVIVETQYMAKPIVATAVSGNVEAIEDGKNGLLVPPQNSDELATKVLDLLNNQEKAMALGACGFISAKNTFSLPKHAGALKDIYIKILKDYR